MRTLILITLIIISATTLRSQIENEYMPIGAKWHYGHEIFGDLVAKNFFTVEVISDTIIDNQRAKILRLDEINELYKPYFNDSLIIIRQIGHRIEYLQEDTFHLLYDFGAEVGDTFSINFPTHIGTHFIGPTTIIYQVDSISTLLINGQMRKVQHLQYFTEEGGLTTYGPLIVEGIGSLSGWLLPYQDCHICKGWWTFLTGLRCYEDNQIGIWQYSEEACDLDIIVNTKEVIPLSMSIFPNPVKYILNLDFGEVFRGQIMLVNALGKMVYQSSIDNRNHTIDVKNLPIGIYFLQIQGAKGYVTRKIFIE